MSQAARTKRAARLLLTAAMYTAIPTAAAPPLQSRTGPARGAGRPLPARRRRVMELPADGEEQRKKITSAVLDSQELILWMKATPSRAALPPRS
jgi:hypothetical protein